MKMNPIHFVFAWVVLATATVLATSASVVYLRERSQTLALHSRGAYIAVSTNSATTSQGTVAGIETTIQGGDARIQLVTDFLRRHDSPLQPYDEWGKKLVDIADKYGIDFRLLPAIAMEESNLCKKIPEGTYNCLGFGITSTQKLAFDSYDASFDRAASALKKNYIDEGLTTPEDIVKKYTPGNDGAWPDSVNQWASEMRYNDHDLGLERKTNANITEFATATPPASPAQ